MEIPREHYLQELRDRMHNGMVKIITGIRRSGKSYLLFHLFQNELLQQGVPKDHIICLSMDGLENMKYRDPFIAYDAIMQQIKDDSDYYVLLDEVQMMEQFEELLNSLLHRENIDTYVTGSNSKFLSKDVITEFRGRGDEVHVYPLTFQEFMQVYDGDVYQGWREYFTYGGLPRTVTLKTENQKSAYLARLFRETYLRDIIERHHIEKTEELDELLQATASTIGALTNPSKILATFQSKTKSTISINTIQKYLEYLEDAFLIQHARRYDIKGRKYIGSPLKYYFEDVGLRNACLGFRQVEETHLMENILYNELRYRGYSVDVGTVKKQERKEDGRLTTRTLEVDFVANLGSRRIYIQSALRMIDDEKRAQEKASLLALKDSFQKVILVRDIVPNYHDNDGVLTMNLFDFLLHRKPFV
ncbi:MAG: ATP-binding protein [Selenomonas sp.]|uniref:ATP-binding protein n=1 Tax=Selenomonas sp. TaxID=2053611 RepID=UPI0025F18B3B|nr:ATP-binding protein [Selenomonas sp.]MCI6086701.1 ATP-binding protein [Selenomonas sp.]